MPTTGEILSKLKNKWVLGILALVVIGIFISIGGSKKNGDPSQIFTVSRSDVRQSVLLSGTVEATNQVDLSFGIGGKVEDVYVTEGEIVESGDALARLDLDVLRTDLLKAEGDVRSAIANISVAEASVRKAEANLALVRAQNRGDSSSFAAAEEKLENTKQEQEVLVANAYQALLSNDLQVYPDTLITTLPTFTLSGSYQGEDEGVYSLKASISSLSNVGYSLSYSGLESGSVNFTDFDVPAALGSRGLFVSFPSAGSGLNYNNSTWVIPVPNNRSATYQTKLNAYNSAKTTATLAIAAAETALEKLQAEEENGDLSLTSAEELQALASLEEARGNVEQRESALLQARAALARVEAQLEDGVIRAPFDGTIARNDFVVGESVTAADLGLTLITDGEFKLSMSVPELDIAKLDTGNEATITLDIYGNDVRWDGLVTSIELIETERDGVPVYESDILVLNPDDRIRVGMNARAEIIQFEVSDVLAIPSSYVLRDGEANSVLVHVDDETLETRIVEVGVRGTNNFLEVVSGLSEGEIIVKPSSQ